MNAKMEGMWHMKTKELSHIGYRLAQLGGWRSLLLLGTISCLILDSANHYLCCHGQDAYGY